MSQVLVLRTIVADSTVKPEITAAMASAADKLADEIKDFGADLISFAIAAFHPKLPETAEQLARAEELLYEAEVSIASLHKDKPVTLIRATMVLALYKLLAKPSLATILYLALVDHFYFLPDKNEQSLREDFIRIAQNVYILEAEASWHPKLEDVAIKNPTSIKAVLTDDVNSSISTALNKAVFNGNLFIQHRYSLDEDWGNAFVAKATEAVVEGLQEVLNASNSIFSAVLTNVEEKVREVQSTDKQIKFLERQAKILWWLQVKYSESAKKSYRDISVEIGAIQMAIDFKSLVTAPVPSYVEAVLVEAMLSTYPDTELELQAAIKEIKWSDSESYPSLTLLSKIGIKDTAKAFEQQIGIPAKTKLTPSQLARWLFRQMQAKAIA